MVCPVIQAADATFHHWRKFKVTYSVPIIIFGILPTYGLAVVTSHTGTVTSDARCFKAFEQTALISV